MDNNDRFKKMLDELANKAQEKTDKSKTKTITSTMPEDRIEQVEAYAKATNISKSKAISDLVGYGFLYLMDLADNGKLDI